MLLARPEVRALLAGHDIGAFYRVLGDNGWSQHGIAKATKTQQSQVFKIIKGRQVVDYRVLVRIAEGLGIPRELMHLGPGPSSADGAYAGGVTAAELAGLPSPSPVPLPDRIFEVQVAKVRDLTRRLIEAGDAYGSDPEVSSAAAAWATRLLGVPGAELASEVGDAYLQATALSYAGLATEEHGHPDDGLKFLQYAQAKAWDIPSDDGRKPVVGEGSQAAVEACARADSATALARLDCWDTAYRQLWTSRELWQPTPTDPAGDLDYVAARLMLEHRRVDAAEPFTAASVRRWEGSRNQRARTQSSILLATIHVRAGKPRGLQLAGCRVPRFFTLGHSVVTTSTGRSGSWRTGAIVPVWCRLTRLWRSRSASAPRSGAVRFLLMWRPGGRTSC